MLIAWTTVTTREQADQLATGAVEQQLAACVQIDGPIASVYRWEGKLERAAEYRLTFKYLPENAPALARWVLSRHPYETPEWLVVSATEVGEKYLSWAKANSSNPPL
jgi:periplasmic divalent cation tolerance protein